MEQAIEPAPFCSMMGISIGSIKGVGEKRLDEIMAVIERHLGV